MIEIVITKNDANQRFDRFLRKYFENAPLSVIQKNIRKKNFKINDKRAKADTYVYENDRIKMYISDDNYNKWLTRTDFKPTDFDLDIVFEDKNIIIMDKESGLLTHSTSKADYGNNLVDNMLSYLYKTKQVDKSVKTFNPAVVNRLDRNTAGLVIGAKNANALRSLNKAIRENEIEKYYLTIVKGEITDDFTVDTTISKNENKNKIKSSKDGSRIITHFKSIATNGKYTLLECKLITGKTHQIRFSLGKNNTPIIGDRKYGDKKTNKLLNDKFKINNQVLLAYKLKFNNIEKLGYLKDKTFISKKTSDIEKLKDQVFDL
ncbi:MULTISPECIES: RluA family pseudouridine synthase [Anaerococcus]|uniref:RluA family pseudouridine synthase n=1 Tax=Anaerococcus TaxID=165779 RepID=UPI00235381B4|nr:MULTISPECIES: RluA family pseudouridine synthase [Anaerococcus]MDU2598492.1 RluA family pseudouridine synthase [Anaerococcus sp.]MDU5535067.1 RluA family pseudouridine synthase [Anaerococcus sp.]MDU7411649.1 RluA family pseudouridine synthase [Anaerococcus sp.]